MRSSNFLIIGVVFVAVFASWPVITQAQDSCAADVLFILDTSGSMGENYTLAKEFMKNIVETWCISEECVHVAAFIVGNNAVLKIPLTTTYDKTALKDLIQGLPFQDQRTNTQQAPQKALDHFNEQTRTGAKRVAIFITDGEKTHEDIEINDPIRTHETEGPKLKNAGVEVVFITLNYFYSIGNMDKTRHQQYATDLNHFKEYETFDTLPTTGPATINGLLTTDLTSCTGSGGTGTGDAPCAFDQSRLDPSITVSGAKTSYNTGEELQLQCATGYTYTDSGLGVPPELVCTDTKWQIDPYSLVCTASTTTSSTSTSSTTTGPTGPVTLDIQPPVVGPEPMTATFTCTYAGAIPSGASLEGLDISKKGPLQTLYAYGSSPNTVDPIYTSRVTTTKAPNPTDFQTVITLSSANWCTDAGEYGCFADPNVGSGVEGIDTLEASKSPPILYVDGQPVSHLSEHTLSTGEHSVSCEAIYNTADVRVTMENDFEPGVKEGADCTHRAKITVPYTLEENGQKTFTCEATYGGDTLAPVSTTLRAEGSEIVPTMTPPLTTGASSLEGLSVIGFLLTLMCAVQIFYIAV